MSMEDAFAPAEAHYRAQIEAQTWGHLAPEPRKKYKGYIYFTHTQYGDLDVIRQDFEGLSGGPWFYEDLMEWTSDRAADRAGGKVYKFTGTYEKFKTGGYRFSGKIVEVPFPV